MIRTPSVCSKFLHNRSAPKNLLFINFIAARSSLSKDFHFFFFLLNYCRAALHIYARRFEHDRKLLGQMIKRIASWIIQSSPVSIQKYFSPIIVVVLLQHLSGIFDPPIWCGSWENIYRSFLSTDIDNNGFLDQKDFDCMGKAGWNARSSVVII